MFRPSSSLLFRPMPALNKLKIHQQLPLSKRESEQLLNLLTTSFRHNLDTEHPSITTADHVPRTVKSNTKPRRRSVSDYEGHHTDRHMQSLLTNPLFTPPTSRRISRVERDPMEVFDSAVARGMMDLNHAKACLIAKKDRIIQTPVLNLRDGMAASGAGMKVLRWLISSGISNDNQFLKDQDFAELLMSYMVAEGLHEHAWRWIKRSFENVYTVSSLPFDEESKPLRREVAGPLRALVKAEMGNHGINLDAAYMCISRAASYLTGASSVEMTTALQPAGLLILRTCKSTSPRPAASETAFESFVSLVPMVVPKRSNHYLAHLGLLHPTKPDATPALEYLRNMASSNHTAPLYTLQPTKKQTAVIQLGLDAAKVLLEQGRYSDLEWTMNFLSNNFPQQLGIHQRRQLQQVKAEVSSIELLETLAIA